MADIQEIRKEQSYLEKRRFFEKEIVEIKSVQQRSGFISLPAADRLKQVQQLLWNLNAKNKTLAKLQDARQAGRKRSQSVAS